MEILFDPSDDPALVGDIGRFLAAMALRVPRDSALDREGAGERRSQVEGIVEEEMAIEKVESSERC